MTFQQLVKIIEVLTPFLAKGVHEHVGGTEHDVLILADPDVDPTDEARKALEDLHVHHSEDGWYVFI